ncbi:MAG: glutaredoxin family protein [Pseudomonadales bacterium]|jgi:hypothetical protein
MHLTLYATDQCTLCERAVDLLLGVPELRGYALDVIDVASDPALIERYGPRLPVLRSSSREIDWPFGREEVRRLLQAD